MKALVTATSGLLLAVHTIAAQHPGRAQAPMTTPPTEARQFDFLIGAWDLTVKVPAPSLAARIHGGTPKLLGKWKAWRALDGWGIEDDLRITDQVGNPMTFAHTVRLFDRAGGRWVTSQVDVYRGRLSTGTAVRTSDEITLISEGIDLEGKPVMNRTKFSQITATSFRFQQDRSTDGGRTWTEGALRIEAKRTAAAAER